MSQLVDAQVIKRLRDLDLPLRAVAEIVRARDPEVTRRIIADHEQVMRERLGDLTRLVDELQGAITQPALQTPAHARRAPEQHTLAICGLVVDPGHDSYAAFLDDAYLRLWDAAQRLGATTTGPSWALYPPKVDGDDEVVTAFMPIAAPVVLDDKALAAGVANQLLPSTTCAVLTHRGAYRTLGESYRQIGAWVVTNAVPADQPVRELYVISADETTGKLLPDDELCTEIAWPIEPASVS
ncbi:MAG: GyrI-like domain-containing protein [Ilumatobacteraceae bacterium]|nr:GyrI-like domain-containing protein [Ilumatobacteraceae bacterium]